MYGCSAFLPFRLLLIFIEDWLKEITTTQALAICGSGGFLAPRSTMSTALAAGDASTGSHQRDTLSGLSIYSFIHVYQGLLVGANVRRSRNTESTADISGRDRCASQPVEWT